MSKLLSCDNLQDILTPVAQNNSKGQCTTLDIDVNVSQLDKMLFSIWTNVTKSP